MTEDLNTWTTISLNQLSDLTPGTLIRACYADSDWVEIESEEDYNKLPQYVKEDVSFEEALNDELEVPNGNMVPDSMCVLVSYQEQSDGEWQMVLMNPETKEIINWSSCEDGITQQHWGNEYDPNDLDNWPTNWPFFQIVE